MLRKSLIVMLMLQLGIPAKPDLSPGIVPTSQPIFQPQLIWLFLRVQSEERTEIKI